MLLPAFEQPAPVHCLLIFYFINRLPSGVASLEPWITEEDYELWYGNCSGQQLAGCLLSF